MNILLIGFRYYEIEEIQDRLQYEFPQLKIDFAISVRDSWYRLKISSYDLIILDTTSSESDDLITHQEVFIKSDGVPVILVTAREEVEGLSHLNSKQPRLTLVKEKNYIEKIITMLKDGDKTSDELELHQHLQFKENIQRPWQYFNASINIIKDPLFIVNNKFKIVEMNGAFLEKYKLSQKEVMGKFCYQVIHRICEPCNEQSWTCPLREVLRLGVPYRSSLNNSHSTHSNKLKTTINATPIKNEINQTDQVIIAFHKETSPPQSETNSLFDRSLLELMLSGLSDGLLFCNSENKILILNQAAESILGLPKAKLIGKSIVELPLGDGANWLIEILKGLEANMRFNSLAFRIRLNDQFVQIRFAPIFGGENHYIGGFLYLTEVDETSKVEEDKNLFILNDKILNVLHLTSPKIIAEG